MKKAHYEAPTYKLYNVRLEVDFLQNTLRYGATGSNINYDDDDTDDLGDF